MAFSGTSLFALSQQFGLASSLLAVEGSVRGLQDLSAEFGSLEREGLLSAAQRGALADLALNGLPSEAHREHIDLPAAVEGQILGRLIRTGEFPDDEKERLRDAVAGRGLVTVKGILEAHRRIRSPWIVSFLRERGIPPHGGPHHVRSTRLERFRALEDEVGRPVYLKREDDQPVGSFKNRGATNLLVNALLAGFDPETLHVGTASHGNHAQGVVQAAHNLGIKSVEVLLTKNASPLKIAQLKLLGAKVELFGETFEECADEVCRRAAIYSNYIFVPAFDQPLVVMGQGTVAVELSLQMAALGIEDYTVVVPAGGGGLVAGMATYLKREGSPEGLNVIGAESKAHPYVSRSYHSNRIVEPEEIKHIDTVADGIALLKIGEAGFANIVRHVRGVEVVPEIFIEAALAYLRENGLTLEGAAATPLAALLYGALDLGNYKIPADRPVVAVASGKNIDIGLLTEMTLRHGEGRWRSLKDRFIALKDRLRQGGWLVKGSVKPLTTAEEGIAFVDFLAANLPEGWDLIDALERLDFGRWRDKKDINATLRSLGQYHQRWNHSKKDALTHPETDRGQKLEFALRDFSDGVPADEILKKFPRMYALRLQVEAHVVDRYLDRPDWLKGLWPAMPAEEHGVYFAQLRGRNDMVKRAVVKFLQALENAEKTPA